MIVKKAVVAIPIPKTPFPADAGAEPSIPKQLRAYVSVEKGAQNQSLRFRVPIEFSFLQFSFL